MFFDGKSKERKNTKGQSAICEGLEKYPKKIPKYKLHFWTQWKNTKKNTKIQGVFFYILFVFFVFFLYVYQKKRKITKKYQKIRMQLLKNTKYKKNTNQQYQKYKIQKKNTNPKFQKYRIQKKIRTQNFKNTKYKEKTNSKISQRANPVFTFGNQEPKYKKNTKPTSCIFQTLQF